MRKLLLFLGVVLSLPLAAQSPFLIRDFNTTYSTGTKGSSPSGFTAWGSRTLFVATTDDAGTELWVTDDTPQGTSMVADIVPGSASSSPAQMKVVNGVLLFTARDANHGIELWTSDGTAAGTQLFLDINPGPSSAQPFSFITYKSRMLFSADDGTHGRELWITDGTVGGTHMVKDIEPGSASSSPGSFVPFGDVLYFSASNALWKTDGTEAGTVKVADVPAAGLRVAGTKLFFLGYTDATGYEPWISDGTAAGTHLIMDILPGPNGSNDSSYSALGMTVYGEGVIFPANDGVHGRELWYSDGTVAGTHMIRDFIPGPTGMWDRSYAYVTTFNGRAYFTASDPVHGFEPWVTDGTDAGTSLFADLAPGSDSSAPLLFTVSGNKLYFAAYRASPSGYAVWVSDGTPEGTRPVNGATLQNSISFGAANGKLYFAGSDTLAGNEPWVTDGTDAGTHRVANLAPDAPPSGNPGKFTTAGNLVFFFASEGLDPSGSGILEGFWRTDGTIAGTVRLGTYTEGYPINNTITLEAAGSIVLFSALDRVTFKSVVMMSDGTPEGTVPAAPFLARLGGNTPVAFYTFGDHVFASVYQDTRQAVTDLWQTSVAPGGSAVKLGPTGASALTDFGGRQLFFADYGLYSYEYGLWSTDGTPGGTFAVNPYIGDDASYRPAPPVNVAGTAWFFNERHNETAKLWKSDGTADGTVPVKTFDFNGEPDIVRVAGHRLFFYSGGSLWTSDGTDAGTIVLAKVPLSSGSMEAAGNRIVFLSNDPNQPIQLWSSDGTVDGTRRVGTLTGYSYELLAVDGQVYFAGNDGTHGVELWITDGTEAGTRMVYDLNPGAAGSNPSGLTRLGNTLLFGATTPSTGYELWGLPLTGSVLSIGDARAAEGDSGNANIVHFPVSLSQPSSQSVTVDYVTTDGTAKAGEDYDANSGTLTFAPGERTKSIDVHVRGDVTPENNEIFYVTLSNAHGATIAGAEGAGIIDDDDQLADLEIVPKITTQGATLLTGVTLTNKGPRAATDVVVNVNGVGQYENRCAVCPVPLLANGDSLSISSSGDSFASAQRFFSATVAARQRDPQTSNNLATWTVSADLAMPTAWLNPGQSATVTASVHTPQATAITVSTPGIVALPPAVTNVSNGIATFQITGLAAGSTTVGIQGQQYPLVVNVVAPGTQPRMPGALSMGGDFSAVTFDHPLKVTIQAAARTLIGGATATGTVTVMVGNQELARQTYSGTGPVTFPVYFHTLGQNNYSMVYGGDANFLPQTVNSTVYVNLGSAVLTGSLDAVPGAAGTYTLTVRASGSPAAAPSGTVSIFNGAAKLATVTLTATSAGVSTGQTTLTGLSLAPLLTVNYSGDAFYGAGTQQFRAASSRHHIVKH